MKDQAVSAGRWAVDGAGTGTLVWYAVQVKRHAEARVVRLLAHKAIPTFLPFLEVSRGGGNGRSPRLEPLFPGYLFVGLDNPLIPRMWDAVRWTPGVRRVLGVAEDPVPVPAAVIAAIQERVREHGFVRQRPRFQRGARVTIRSGPLQGLEAVFDRPMSRVGRVRVLLELLGQQRGVEVDQRELESA
ncbi:MAG: transcription termination/antitermination NusG family protein [Armatimonadota bacterium]|nr:transcription termination/antitermination NusG family protein [Armatimonadota bacterium]